MSSLPTDVLEIILSFLPGYLRVDVSFKLSKRLPLGANLIQRLYSKYKPCRGIPVIMSEELAKMSPYEDDFFYMPIKQFHPISVGSIQRYISFFSRPYMPRYISTIRSYELGGFVLKFDICKLPCEKISKPLMNWEVYSTVDS